MNDACENCAYSYAFERSFNRGPWERVVQCRRHPPVIVNGNSKWPVVSLGDWCGEFKKDSVETP